MERDLHMNCIACKSQISNDASLCPICSTYQKQWRNWLPYIGGAVALLTFVLSAAAYMSTTMIKVFKELTWRDEVQIVSFNSNGSSTILNSGYGQVFLLRFLFESTEISYQGSNQINKKLNKNEFLTINKQKKGQVISGVSDSEWEKYVSYASHVPHEQSFEVFPIFFDEKNAELAIMKNNLGDNLRTFNGRVEIFFLSGKSGKQLKKSFSVEGVLCEILHE